MKKITVIISVLGILALMMFAGCQKQEAAKPAEQPAMAPATATAPSTTPTATAPAAEPAK